MVHKLLYFLTGFLKCRVIDCDGKPYLERYYVGTWFGKRYFIHRFMSSDPDRGLHDHPWRWAKSYILAGGYNELVLKDDMIVTKKRRAPEINKFDGRVFHRVLLPDENAGKTWTLFVHGPREKSWGFLEYTYDDINQQIIDSKYRDVVTKEERKKNENWWKKPDAKTGREVRKERLR